MNEPENLLNFLNKILPLGSISILAAASRTILSEDRRSFIGFMRGLVLAIFVSMVVGWGIENSSISQEWRYVIIAVTAFSADDILMILLSITQKLREDPMIVIDYLMRLLPQGGSTGAK